MFYVKRNLSSDSEEEDWSVNLRYFIIIVPCKRPFICKFNSKHPRMHCSKLSWNWSSSSGDEDVLTSSMCCRYFLFIPLANEFWGIYWFQPVHLSVYPSVPVYGHDFVHACSKKWVSGIFENLYTRYSPCECVHLEFSDWLDKYSPFQSFCFCFSTQSFIKQEICCLKNYEKLYYLNIENGLFLNWNFNCITYFDSIYLEYYSNFILYYTWSNAVGFFGRGGESNAHNRFFQFFSSAFFLTFILI